MNAIKTPFAHSALSHRSVIEGDAIRLSERSDLAKVMLRGDMKALAAWTKKALEITAPKSCKSTYRSGAALHWLGPDTLMFVGADNADDYFKALSDAQLGQSGQVVLVSDHYTIIEVSGAHARNALQKLSTLDLHAKCFKKGDVAGTILGHSTVTLVATDDESFDIIVRRSHADYLWCLLANAGFEYGLPKQEPIGGEILRSSS